MSPKKIEFTHNHEYFAIFQTDPYLDTGKNDIFSLLKEHEIKMLFLLEHDIKARFQNYLFDKPIDFLEGMKFQDIDIRRNNGAIYFVHMPSVAIYEYNEEKLTFCQNKWKELWEEA